VKLIEGDRLGEGDYVRLKRVGEVGYIGHVFDVYPFRGGVVVLIGERREPSRSKRREKVPA